MYGLPEQIPQWDVAGGVYGTAKTNLFLQTNGPPMTMNILGNSDNNFPNKTVSSSGFILLVNLWAFYIIKRWGGKKKVPLRDLLPNFDNCQQCT